MRVEEVVDVFRKHPVYLDSGAGKLSRRFNCSREDIYEAKFLVRKDSFITKNEPKILILDIETSPLLAFVYQTQVWNARIGHDNIVSQWFMLTFSCKWLGSEEVMSDRLTSFESQNEDDSRIIRRLWLILDEADICIAHNGDRFDIPNINTRFIVNGLRPTKYYKQIDTLKVAQKQFGFTHNSLNALASVFGIPGKIETNFDLWKRCVRGEELALEEMETYNRQDVRVLERVYLKLRPWIKSHVNLSLYNDDPDHQCPHCLSKKLRKEGNYYTHTGKFETYKCMECGAMSRERKSILDKGKIKNLLVSIPGR